MGVSAVSLKNDLCSALKSKSCHDANFVVTGSTGDCPNDNLQCCLWRQSWHHDNSQSSGYLFYSHTRATMMPTLSSQAALEVVLMTTSSAACYDKVGIMATFHFQYIYPILTHDLISTCSFLALASSDISKMQRPKIALGHMDCPLRRCPARICINQYCCMLGCWPAVISFWGVRSMIPVYIGKHFNVTLILVIIDLTQICFEEIWIYIHILHLSFTLKWHR